MRAPEHTRRHRTIARVALALLLMWALTGTVQARAERVERSAKPPPHTIVFPIVGPATYENDFGDPRGQGSHQGNDMMTAWKAPLVAAEAGKVRIYTGSSRAGCMLYLYGSSGTTYLYIHLNNDLTAKNDNKGRCKPGIAFAEGLKDGQRVRAGQLIGYAGDSGDANGVGHHLHFELHPGNRSAVSPYPWLKRANHVLFPYTPSLRTRDAASARTLMLTGKVTAVSLTAPPSQPTEPTEPEPQPEEPAQPQEPTTGPAEPPGSPEASGPEVPTITGNDGMPPARDATGASVSTITVRVTSVRHSGATYRVTKTVKLKVAEDIVISRAKNGAETTVKAAALKVGLKVSVTTSPLKLTLGEQLGKAAALAAARILIRAS